MKIKKQKNHKKKIIITLTVAILAILAVFLYIFATHSTSKKSLQDETTVNKSVLPSNKPSPESDKKTTNTDPQAETSKDKETGKTVVSVVSSVNVIDKTVYIRGGINNTVDVNGSCYALLNGPDGSSIKKETPLLQGASTTDCKTIQIPVSELSQGQWSYTLNYSSKDSEGKSSENSFNI